MAFRSIRIMSVTSRRGVVLAAVLSLALLVPGRFPAASAASQPPAAPPPASAPVAPAPAAKRTPRINALNEALKSLELTAEQKNKIKEIRAQSRKDLDAIPNRRSPEGQTKLRELNEKVAADIKASLPADLQAKFQTAYDAAEAKNAEQAKARGAAAGLRDFKQPLASLNLTADQQAKVDPIVKESYDKIVAMRQDRTMKRADRTSKLDATITDMKGKIRPLITPAQQTQLDALDLKPKSLQGGRNRGAGRGDDAPGTGGAKAPAAPAL
jgi:Spy/CpxP family protein refolding chaperone